MITPRGWWLLVASAVVTLVGLSTVANIAPAVPILGLTLFTWVLIELLVFAVRLRIVRARLVIRREVRQGERSVAVAWAGQSCRVRLTIENHSQQMWPLVFLRDRVPEGYRVSSGEPQYAGSLSSERDETLEYELKPESAGAMRFEGIEVQVTDLAGLFYFRWFVRQPVDLLVLPPLVDEDGQHRSTKRYNSLPPPGEHRLRRPGGGSELLDLRDYRPGDPPKMIAWKASARRDRLITKEYESDVPIRCVIFLDTSAGVRLGPPEKTIVSQFVGLASGVSQAAAAGRDLVGLVRFHDTGSDDLRPARTSVHLIRLLGLLADAAAAPPDVGGDDPNELARVAQPVVESLYPDLLAKDLNTRPWGLYWRPLLDSRWGWLVLLPLIGWMALLYFQFVPVLNFAGSIVRAIRPRFDSAWVDIPLFLLLLGLCLVFPFVLAFWVWVFYGVKGLWNPSRERTRRRKQLATVFTALDRDAASRIERYLHDDDEFVRRTRRFLSDHRVRLSPMYYDSDGKYLFRCDDKAVWLVDAMVRSVGRAQDNELYVILADLVDLSDDARDKVLRAVKVATARHHQVVVVMPWPDDVPPPGEEPAASATEGMRSDSNWTNRFVRLAMIHGHQARFEALRRQLARSGATVLRVDSKTAVRSVLDRLTRMRAGRGRR